MTRTDRKGLSLTEILIAVVILAIAGIPLYQVLSMGLKGVERTRDQMIAFSVAEKIQEELNHMLHEEDMRQQAIDFETPTPEPLTSIPFFPKLKAAIESAVAAAPGASRGDTTKAVKALDSYRYTVKSQVEKPGTAPQAIWMSKAIGIHWKDIHGRDKELELDATFANSDIYYQVVKANYANATSITDRIMQDIASRRAQPLVTYDSDALAKDLTYPLKSNEFIDPNPWYEKFIAQAPGLTEKRRLGTKGATSDERMAVKEAALSQFFGFTADEARVITYDLKDEAEEVVKKLENLPKYSQVFENVQGVEGVGVRAPGKPGPYTCVNCHAPEFLVTLDEGYLSIPKGYLEIDEGGKTGKEWLLEFLGILKDNGGITAAEHDKYAQRLDDPDVGIFSGATSSGR